MRSKGFLFAVMRISMSLIIAKRSVSATEKTTSFPPKTTKPAKSARLPTNTSTLCANNVQSLKFGWEMSVSAHLLSYGMEKVASVPYLDFGTVRSVSAGLLAYGTAKIANVLHQESGMANLAFVLHLANGTEKIVSALLPDNG